MSSVWVVCGTDDGQVAEAAGRKATELTPPGGDDFSQEIIAGSVSNAEEAFQAARQVAESLQTVGFFATGKMVWLKGANFLASDRTSEAQRAKDGAELLLETLKAGLPPGVNFLVSAAAIDKRRALYKWLQKNAEVEVYDRIDISKDGWEEAAGRLVKELAKERGLTFGGEALAALVNRAGVDSRLLQGEVEKIDLYLGEERREVTAEDVRLMVAASHKGIIWEISRALEKKNAPVALRLVDQQLDQGENGISVVRAALIPTIRRLFLAKAVLGNGRFSLDQYKKFQGELDRLPEARKALVPRKKDGGLNAWAFFTQAKTAKKFSLGQLQKALRYALEADLAMVTSSQDHRMLIHRLVVQVCGK